ncbi:hypothetical protein AVEN_138351-1, partial [Araneus ventricosus]
LKGRDGLVVRIWFRSRWVRGSKPDSNAVYVDLTYVKADVVREHIPAADVRNFGEGLSSS